MNNIFQNGVWLAFQESLYWLRYSILTHLIYPYKAIFLLRLSLRVFYILLLSFHLSPLHQFLLKEYHASTFQCLHNCIAPDRKARMLSFYADNPLHITTPFFYLYSILSFTPIINKNGISGISGNGSYIIINNITRIYNRLLLNIL